MGQIFGKRQFPVKKLMKHMYWKRTEAFSCVRLPRSPTCFCSICEKIRCDKGKKSYDTFNSVTECVYGRDHKCKEECFPMFQLVANFYRGLRGNGLKFTSWTKRLLTAFMRTDILSCNENPCVFSCNKVKQASTHFRGTQTFFWSRIWRKKKTSEKVTILIQLET